MKGDMHTMHYFVHGIKFLAEDKMSQKMKTKTTRKLFFSVEMNQIYRQNT